MIFQDIVDSIVHIEVNRIRAFRHTDLYLQVLHLVPPKRIETMHCRGNRKMLLTVNRSRSRGRLSLIQINFISCCTCPVKSL